MTPETRRNVLRYGIAIDLVILATGAAMLLPPMPVGLLLIFGVAVLLSVWKGGWQGGLTALLLSVIALATMFDASTASLLWFSAACVVAGGAWSAAASPARSKAAELPRHSVDEDAGSLAGEAALLEEEPVRAAGELEEVEHENERSEEEPVLAAREREEEEREQARLEAARVEAEALAVREREEREEAERVALEAQLAREREEAEREKERLEAVRAEAEARAAREREEAARVALEAQLVREREEAEREKARLEAARAEAEARVVREREEREAAERALQAKLAEEREAMRLELEQQLATEREALAREAAAKIEEAREAVAPPPPPPPPLAGPAASSKPTPKASLLDTVAGWFHREPRTRPNLTTTRITANGTATKRPAAPRRPVSTRSPKVRRPRLVLLERRRGTADTVLPKLRQRGIDVSVVERWVDAVDELLRMKPDAFLLDIEHPDFAKAHRTTTEKSGNLPIVLTGRPHASAALHVAHAAFLARPYDVDTLARLAEQAMSRPDELLAMQAISRAPSTKPVASTPSPAPPRRPEPPPRADVVVAMKAGSNDEYEVQCFTCRAGFNAVDSDWCSCLTKERTLVCTNCLACFCKAPPAYKEKFWVEAPARLFERKSEEAKKSGALAANPAMGEVKRPLVLTVEDDEEIQAIVQRVCANLGYGFIYATNGQDGLDVAREYRPNLILSDAFMPKLDGREMCRTLKDDPAFADTRMVVMTGLYTDTKYRSEALKRFRVDDYIAKPVAITDLINLLQKHIEGAPGLPLAEDLRESQRQESDDDIPLADVLAAPDSPQMQIASAAGESRPDAYDVCCASCEELFDATQAEWCRCVGRDNTLVCTHCGGCFCKAPAAYKERFWSDAPPSLFERKMIGSKRSLGARANPPAADVKRPLILLVEDDENVQLIVKTVVTTMGFGFVVGANGQEGLTLAREYSPELILSDAFMPKLDGREMCRLLKEDPTTARSKAIIMTGLYTDRKYRNEALDYFKVDDYVAKPLAVDDLIKLFKKHLPQEVATAH